MIKVPKLEELTSLRLAEDAAGDKLIGKYLPEYKINRAYNRQFLFNVSCKSIIYFYHTPNAVILIE